MRTRWNARLDHAAIATRDPAKLKHVLGLLGLADNGTEDVPSQGVRTYFLKPATGTAQVEILDPIVSEGVIAKYLAKKGPGIHHISFLVDGLDALCEELRANAVRLVYETPQAGAHRTRVNFIHPESTGGILIEIAEVLAQHF